MAQYLTNLEIQIVMQAQIVIYNVRGLENSASFPYCIGKEYQMEDETKHTKIIQADVCTKFTIIT